MGTMNRRKFFSGLGSGFLGLGAFAFPRKPLFGFSPSSEEDSYEPRIRTCNQLGTTGLEVSDVSFGAADVFSENVIRYAFDLGVNLFDTAENYQNGKSEGIVGKGLKGVRDKAVILTKYNLHRQPPEKLSDVTERVETSLQRMNTDHIDIAFFYHGINDPGQLKNDIIMEAAEKLKKEGKIRFSGFSTHNAAEMLTECVKPEYKGFVEVVLFIYNHIDGKPIEQLVKNARDAGIGTIAMKSLAGGKQGNLESFVNDKQTYEVAALKWVLGNPRIDTAVISMKTYSHVDAYLKASGQKLKRDDLSVLERYRKEVDHIYCRLECNVCEASCPGNVAISDIMRFAMYYEDYQHERVALDEYSRLDRRNKPLDCAACSGHCDHACPYQLKVKEKLLQAHAMLT